MIRTIISIQLYKEASVLECIFCNIIEGKLPAEFVYQDEDIVAFHDVQPQAPVHFLVVPKAHITDLNTFDNDALVGRILKVAKKLATEHGIAESGYRLVANCNAAGGQTVYHVHFHLLGGRNMTWPPG